VQGVGKVADRPAAGRRKRIRGAARSFFHHLARARSSAPQKGLVSLQGRGAHECFGGVAGCPRSGSDGRVSRFISPAYTAGRGIHTPALFLDRKVGT
jgi:hypothetical protein